MKSLALLFSFFLISLTWCNTLATETNTARAKGTQQGYWPSNDPFGSDIAISDLTLLLPHTINAKNEVQYKLEAYNGCFKW
jgi:hypothetical protein